MKKILTISDLSGVSSSSLTCNFKSGNFKTRMLIVIFSFLLLMPVSCIDEYRPDLGGKYENALVVDGTITNDPGPYTVTLTRSSSVDNPRLVYYPGCQVSILCDDGTSEILTEESDGIYVTAKDGIRGEIGKKYEIRIVTPDDDIYESTYEELKKPGQIESVYAEVEYKHSEEVYHDLSGYQFYIDAKSTSNDTSYFLWKLETTYKFHSSFWCYYYFDDGELKPFPKFDSLFTCWRTEKIPTIYTYETSGLTESVIKRFPLNYVSTEERELTIKYSLLVRQYTLSKEAYTFWNSVRLLNDKQGSLYTTLPYQIRGNVVNINDPGELVLGYFLVAGIEKQRIYKERPPLQFYYSDCQLTQADFEAAGWVRYTPAKDWPVYLTQKLGARALPNQDCIDCRKKNGTVIKPDFWIGR